MAFNARYLCCLPANYRTQTPPPPLPDIELGPITSQPGQLVTLTVRETIVEIDVEQTRELIEQERQEQEEQKFCNKPGVDMACTILAGPIVTCPGLAATGTAVKTSGLLAANPCGATTLMTLPIVAGAALPLAWLWSSNFYKKD